MDRIAVNAGEACQMLGISRTVLYRLLREGAIPSITVGRRRLISVKDLETFVEGNRYE